MEKELREKLDWLDGVYRDGVGEMGTYAEGVHGTTSCLRNWLNERTKDCVASEDGQRVELAKLADLKAVGLALDEATRQLGDLCKELAGGSADTEPRNKPDWRRDTKIFRCDAGDQAGDTEAERNEIAASLDGVNPQPKVYIQNWTRLPDAWADSPALLPVADIFVLLIVRCEGKSKIVEAAYRPGGGLPFWADRTGYVIKSDVYKLLAWHRIIAGGNIEIPEQYK